MDFLERIFNLSPDGGNGVSELIILACLLLAVGLYSAFRRVRRHKQV
ncbi:MAG TPA: hypothetical protein VE959_04675 [Bryobacteraceae bacterium]|nr:hypothetical protein [Bryobacteraceae bacterium]